MNRSSPVNTLSVFALLAAAQVCLAGPLSPPPGSVTSTMKTMSEVEPRIAINAVNTPGDADSLFKITQPGSYYLVGNIQGVAGKKGIEVASSNVTIDLNGFSLIGVAGSGDGIATSVTNSTELAVFNGTITGWGGDGLDTVLSTSPHVHLSHVSSTNNTGYGLRPYQQSIVEDCSATGNGGIGFDLYRDSVISHCVAKANSGKGFDCAVTTVLSECIANENAGGGFHINSDSVVTHCDANFNTGTGFSVTGEGAALTGCLASSNSQYGISVGTSAVITGCTARANASAGIYVLGNMCRLSENTCNENSVGIQAVATGSLFIRNICSANLTQNWNIAAGNKCLVVNAVNAGAITGNAGGISIGSTDPNANFTY